MTHPSNQDILDSFRKHAGEDAKFQHETNEVHKAMMKRMDTLVTKEDVRVIFSEELGKFFKVSGLNIKTIIVTTAMIIGAMTVIFGGIKAMLGWIGFHYLGK